jgi:hypothetical protein
VDDALFDHAIVGPKIASIAWTGPTSAEVELRGFPMDKMPPVMRNKFKSSMNEKISGFAKEHDVSGAVSVELIDTDSRKVMDRLDGKEWVGAFDESQYE